jgi:hypothetical protein
MNPTEGVEPRDMIRQILGERLNIGSVLTWGPDYYYQKQFFSGHDDALSLPNRLMHYDLEVSGFPSSHAGHIVLLKLKEQDYPQTKRIEDWPTWDLPIFRWAKAQGAITGFAHSGWGLQVTTKNLPTYDMPGFDDIGANEYIVDVTHPGMVDFISAVDTPYAAESQLAASFGQPPGSFTTGRPSSPMREAQSTRRRKGLARSTLPLFRSST